jgi:hypothetical protein
VDVISLLVSKLKRVQFVEQEERGLETILLPDPEARHGFHDSDQGLTCFTNRNHAERSSDFGVTGLWESSKVFGPQKPVCRDAPLPAF